MSPSRPTSISIALALGAAVAACAPELSSPSGYTTGTTATSDAGAPPSPDGGGGTGGDGGSAGGGAAPCGVEVPCNGIDDDCDPSTPDGSEIDRDEDGASACDDCDDDDASAYPGATEVCGNTVDEDCTDGPAYCFCGDGTVDPGEVCDDGNTVAGDGCRADCLGTEICGDGLADLDTEACDGPQDGACIGACVACACTSSPWTFADVTVTTGIDHQHDFVFEVLEMIRNVSGGMAVGDYDDDGWVDIYAVGGKLGTATLWHNEGDGTFTDAAIAAGVALVGHSASGATFGDVDGDGLVDLLVSGIEHEPTFLFRNEGDGTFSEATAVSGLQGDENAMSAAFGDYDRDGDLDLALAHWFVQLTANPCHLWQNDGAGRFTAVGASTGLENVITSDPDLGQNAFTFATTFSDYDDDGWPDLFVVADFSTSRIAHNDGGTFSDATTAVVTDENGMGSAIGDYDNDGDLDWFVTSVFDPTRDDKSGNRLYENLGDGTFADATDAAGVRVGHWGWGACFADFNNDGHLDIFHTNGFTVLETTPFENDPSVLFINDGDGTYTERAWELGLVDPGQGRGVSCFDYDRDGDIDLAVFNNHGTLRIWENRLPAGRHYLSVKLVGTAGNHDAIGAKVTATTGANAQIREIRAGTNYLGQNPPVAHFGLDERTVVDTLSIRWPDGVTSSLTNVAADQHLVVSHP